MKESRQMGRKKEQEQNNGGLTLVELLVSIAVLMVVSSAIFSFILTGSRFFNRHSAEADMQSEAQIMKNYLDDLIRDTGRGLTYYGEGYKEADRCLVIYGEKVIAFLGWIQSEGKVHYLEKEVTEDNFHQEGGHYEITFEEWENNAANWPILSEYMTDFSVSLAKLTEEHQLFTCDMAFSLRQRDMKTAHTITLRNQIVNAERLEEIYEDLPGIGNKILGITLEPQVTDRRPGGTVQYHSVVIGTGTVSQDVIYEVTGNQSVQTTISSTGLLTIGADETAELLTVSVTAAVDAEVSATATVNIAKVVGVTIVPETQPQHEGAYFPGPGNPIKLRADVEGDFLGENAREVEWSVVAEETEIPLEMFQWQPGGIYCTLTVADDETIYGKKITMKATSKLDPSKWDTHAITIAQIAEKELVIVAPEFKIKRGGTLDLDAKVIGVETTDSEFTWEIIDNGGLKKGELTIDTKGVLTADRDINYKRGFVFTIQVTWKKSGYTTQEKTCIVIMDEVAIRFVPSYAVIIIPGNGVQEKIKIETDGIVPEAVDLRQTGNTGINSVVRDGTLYLSINKDEVPKKDSMELELSMIPGTPGAPSVSETIKIYFYKSNLILTGTERYAPVPGDSFLTDTEKPGVPDTEKTMEIDGKTYGYKTVTVQGILYEYLVEKPLNNTWYMRVQGEKYTYNGTRYVKVVK